MSFKISVCTAILSVLLQIAQEACSEGTTCQCGKSTQGRIIGGELANINDYPWLLAMHVGDAEKGFRFSCGASLIHPKWVVTAGHCVQNVPKNGYAKDGQCYTESHEVAPCFYLGDQIKLALSRTQGEILEIPVAKVIPNPQFEPNASPYHHDIALLQLRKTLSCNKFVSPVCVSEGQYMDYPNRPVFLAGWGKTDNSQNGKTPVLKQTPLVVKLHEECYENTKLESVLCATGYPFGSTPCQGDSGGPLMYNDGKLTYLTGIVSYGRNTCVIDGNVMFTKLFDYLQWIMLYVPLQEVRKAEGGEEQLLFGGPEYFLTRTEH